MKKTISILVVVAAAFIAAQQAQAQTISIQVGKGGLSKGKTTRASVVMNIPGGLHVNSNRPKSEYAVATKVTVSAEGATTGAVSYPPGKMKKFSFSDTPISIYEGRVSFGFNVTVPANYRGRMVKLKAEVLYQACTDEVCYPPRTKTVYLNVRVR